MSDDIQIISTDDMEVVKTETWDRQGGRKNSQIVVHNRRIELAERMADGISYHKIVEWYCPTFEVGEPMLQKDMGKVRKEWRKLVFENSFEDTLSEAMARIKKSYEVALKTNQPSAMQSAIVQELKILGIYNQYKNEIQDKEITIQYEVVDKRENKTNEN